MKQSFRFLVLCLFVAALLPACGGNSKATPTPTLAWLPIEYPTLTIVTRIAVFGEEDFQVRYDNTVPVCVPYSQEYQLLYRGWSIDESRGDAGHAGIALVSDNSEASGFPEINGLPSPVIGDTKIELDYQPIADDKVKVEGEICGLISVRQIYRVYKVH